MKFYKLGIVSINAINQYIAGVVTTDNTIKELLNILGVVRRVNSSDRDFYKTWNEDWNFDYAVIALVAEKAKNTASPLRYMNKLLLELNTKGIHDAEKAKAELSRVQSGVQESKKDFTERDYTKEELNALFDSLDDIEV